MEPIDHTYAIPVQTIKDADMFNLPKLSKNAMRKIKTDGAYEGKNKIIFGADGKIIRGDDHDKSEYMSKLRKESEKGGKTVGLVDEDDVSDGDAQDTYIKRVKQNLQENLKEDEKTAKERLREKRIKTKRKMKMMRGEDPDDREDEA